MDGGIIRPAVATGTSISRDLICCYSTNSDVVERQKRVFFRYVMTMTPTTEKLLRVSFHWTKTNHVTSLDLRIKPG